MVSSAANINIADEETEAILRRADEALHSLRSSFADEAANQISQIAAALQDLSADPDSLADQARNELFDVIFEASHEIKGQAGSFGYDLLTHVCDSLCYVIEGRDALPGDPVEAVRHHLDAARLIFDQDLMGDGGAAGVALLGELGRIKVYLAASSSE